MAALHEAPTPLDDTQLFERYQRERRPEDGEALVRRFMPLARHLARRYRAERVVEARSLATAHRPISLDRPINDADETIGILLGHEDPCYVRAEAAVDLTQLLEQLPERERTVLRLRFEEDLVQREIAERIGLSQMHACRLITRSIHTLQRIAAEAEAVSNGG